MDKFGKRLIGWYGKNKRELPWRSSSDPYKIWLSEIILQQTRVEQGLAYYLRFVERYPDVFSLANASDDEVFKLWQGLGYYNRAANMLVAAKTIVEQYKGSFPKNPKDLIKIKGIGSYTSAAIASLAFGVSIPVVDGNVFRLLSRLYGIKTPINTSAGKKEFEYKASELIKDYPPGTFNQAFMEFGALQCKPKNPNCTACIFNTDCHAFTNQSVSELPVKKPKAAMKNRYLYYFLVEVSGNNFSGIYMKKRRLKDIWKNLYDFPLIESKKSIDTLEVIAQFSSANRISPADFTVKSISTIYIHQLTHQKIHAQFFRLIVDKKINLNSNNSLLLIDIDELINYPVPRLIERYLQEQGIIK